MERPMNQKLKAHKHGPLGKCRNMDKHSLRNVQKNKKYFIEHEIETTMKKTNRKNASYRKSSISRKTSLF